jgi:DNA polymerase-1
VTQSKDSIDKSSPEADADGRRLIIIDGANAIYRAFFALPGLHAPDGTPTNAAYGFVTMLIKALREERPTHIAVASDPRGGSFRREIYPEYKATRDAQPEDLTVQFPIIAEICEAFGVPMLEVPNFEADDVIATLVETAPPGTEIGIISTDKDLMQLVGPDVTLLDTMKGRRIDVAAVEKRFGVPPSKLLDVRSLVGDPSDNIPGVKGIGEKGAAKLILEWGSLDALLDGAAEVKAKRAREGLIEHADDARLSRELATLRSDLTIDLGWDGLAVREPDRARLRELYKRYGFTRLLDALDADMDPETGPQEGRDASGSSSGSDVDVEIIGEASDLEKLVEAAVAVGTASEAIALHPIVDGDDAISSELLGLAIALPGRSVDYLILRGEGLFDREGLAREDFVAAMSQIWEQGLGPAWVGFDTKAIQSLFTGMGIALPLPDLDVLVAGQMLDSNGPHELSNLAQAYLQRNVSTWEEVAGRGAKAKSVADLGVEIVSQWAAGQASGLLAIRPVLVERLASEGLSELYDRVERPLTAVLSRMEIAGVRIDEKHLLALSEEYEKELVRIEAEIHRLAGEKFLVSSPKQLQVILFEKLGLPILKKTKTGYSTAESVLEQLTAHHELPARVLAWRKLSKLKSTYIDALPPLVNPKTGRIHPHFHQVGAATGRLSASNPNVQNIPIRGAEGVRIREAFIAAEGRMLLSADYSQVELRIMAHYSGDASLIEAFRRGDDIHRRTAAEVADIDISEVSDEQRARAKAVNFGIIYGSSAFGLAQQLGIAAGEAQETIDAYFARYEGVRRFLDETTAQAKKDGFVQTYMGRRRYLPDLVSRNRVLRQAAERMATNTVIQGSAADLIKKAMVEVDAVLLEVDLEATMTLQVHDELVFETSEHSRDALSQIVVEKMEGVAELAVPLTVDLGFGRNWREAH